MKQTILIGALLIGANSFADSYVVSGQKFDSKAAAIRYVVQSGKRLEVEETRCMIVTNKFSLKACPKNKKGSFENQQFESISKTE